MLLAAEENGGIGFGFYLPERDATLAALLLVEAQNNLPLGLASLHAEVEKIAGKAGFCRYNFVPTKDRQKIFERISSAKGKDFSCQKIDSVTEVDSIKVSYSNGDWMGFRISGTENVIRVYCEAETHEKAILLRDKAVTALKTIEINL